MEKKNGSRLVSFVICAVIVFFIVAAFKLQMELNELRKQKEQLEAQLREARIEYERIAEEVEKSNTDEYKKQVAKDRLDYKNSGDTIYYNDITDE